MSGFFGSSALEIILALIFIYFLLATFSSSIVELIASRLKWRSTELELSIYELLSYSTYADRVWKHPLIQELRSGTKNKGRDPSYIPSTEFAKALLDVLFNDVSPNNDNDVGKLKKELKRLDASTTVSDVAVSRLSVREVADRHNKDFKKGRPIPLTCNDRFAEQSMTAVLRFSNTPEAAEKALAAWFDAKMGRATGVYKRKSQNVLILVAIALVALLGADSLQMYERLATDPTARDYFVAKAEERVDAATATSEEKSADESVEDNSCGADESNEGSGTAAGEDQSGSGDSNSDAGTNCDNTTDEQNQQKNSAETADNLASKLIDAPFGWQDERPEFTFSWETARWTVWKVLGLGITVLAIIVGAPFWFDLITKIVNIRRAGLKPPPVPPPGDAETGSAGAGNGSGNGNGGNGDGGTGNESGNGNDKNGGTSS